MNAIFTTLKPSALLGIVFVLILLVQEAFFTTGSMTYSMGDTPDKTESSYGIGAPIRVTTTKGLTTYDVNWERLVGNILCCYIFAALLTRAFTCATRFRRPGLAYGITALIMIALSFCLAVALSRMTWGYYFSRPRVLAEMKQVETVTAVIPVKTISEKEGHRQIVTEAAYSIADRLAFGKKDSYYCLDERLLIALEERNLLPSHPLTDLSRLPDLFPLIHGTGILAAPDEGYNDSDMLSGVVIDAVGKSGQRLVILGLTGRQLSNDHYPYYEMVFSGTPGSKALSYIRGQRFFYDVAGCEGGEWYVIWPVLALVGIIVGFLVVTAAILTWRIIKTLKKIPPPPPPDGSHAAGSPPDQQ